MAFKRVLILSQYYAPESGAPAIRLRAMVKELVKLGYDVRVVTGMPNYPKGEIYDGYAGKLWMRDEVDGVPLRRVWLYPASGKGAAKRIINYLSFTASSALALALEQKADLVFVEAQPLTLAFPAWVNKVVRGTPYVYNTPDLQVEYADEGQWGVRGLIRLARGLEGFLMKKSLSVTTVTHAFVEHFHQERGIDKARIAFLPNGADIDFLSPQPRDAAFAEKMGVGNRKVFTFAGTHAPYQGLEVILEAAKLLKHRKDIVILMVGDGPVREKLMRDAEEAGLDNVLFRTSPFSEMPSLMSITWASLVVLRALKIATKMRLSKAIPPLACGVPLIYAGWGETADIVAEEGVGLRVEPEQPQLLAEAIVRMADEPGMREKMGKKGRALAERDFSWATIVGNWVKQIEGVSAHG
ncbi:MAG: glycosyltransferase family 4 protein [Myxococcaceae bacterium]|nr:glycosyltransferase family 4 protein [Myxococcaceae bacterium]